MKFLFIALCAFASASVPLEPQGYVLGADTAKWVVEVYYDHLCSDSKAAFPGLYDYWLNHSDEVQLVIYNFALPFHHNSIVVAAGGKYIHDSHPDQYVAFLGYMFANQGYYLSANDVTFGDMFQKVATDTETATGVSASEVLTAITGGDLQGKLLTEWKAAAARGLNYSPAYFVNGILATTVDCVTADDWAVYFASLTN